jgi:MarR family transcriptional regulator, transcriptional regulator for hemolysin
MTADLDDDFLTLLVDVARHICTYGDQLAQALGLTRAQLIILARLERQPDLSQNELAAIAEVTPMTIARLIDRLEALGLVERYSDPADRRIWRLRLTPAAAPLRREIKNFCAKLQSVATKGIEPAVLKTMAAGLRRMKENVGGRRLVDASPAKPSERPVERISTLARASRRHSA